VGRPPGYSHWISSAASDGYKRRGVHVRGVGVGERGGGGMECAA